MSERIYTGAEALALIDGANNVTLADPGHHCGGSFVECSLAGDCDGEHPTGRLTMLEVDHGEESERIYFAEPKDAALCAAAKGLAASVAHHEKRADSAEALAQIHREERDACAAEAVRLTAERDAARAMVECEANDVVVLRRDLDALRAAVLELREAESARDDLPLDAACDSLVAATSRVVHARVALIELVPGAPRGDGVTRARITPPNGAPFEVPVTTPVALDNIRAEAIHRHGAGTTVDVIDGEPEPNPAGRRIAIVFGSRAVDDTEAAIWWSWRAIAGWMVEGERPDLLLVPDGRGAGFTARRFARAAGIPYDVWRLNGEVVSASGVRRWHDGPVPVDPRWALRRAAAMLDPVALAKAAGADVRALAILAPWDTGGGDRWAIERARGLGLPVTELTCPPEHGPARAALSAHTTTTTTATTEETAP